MATTLTGQQILDAGLHDWRFLVRSIRTRFRTRDFATGLALVNRIGEAAEQTNHHPDLDLRYDRVDVHLVSHDAGGVTERDLRAARRISEIAEELGLPAAPHEVVELELALDTPDFRAVKPFWRALLALEDNPDVDDDLNDPSGVLPTLWFQKCEPHEVPHQRFHLDVWLPHDVAEQRLAAVLAVGGRLVTDQWAPSFWVVADSQGNRACISTWQYRDQQASADA